MKPLPLLVTLGALAGVTGLTLILTHEQPEAAIDTLGPAPLPVTEEFDFNEELPLLPQPPLLEHDLTPDPLLVQFVEEQTGVPFTTPPIFTPADENQIVAKVTETLERSFAGEQWTRLELSSRRLGFLPPFADLKQTLITIGAAEVRGFISADANLIRSDFDAGSPPEQAALVNLLAQRLLSQELTPLATETTPDQKVARRLTIQLLSLAIELKFREDLPDYPPSLHENMREAIMLGMPSFFHELANFAEFQLLDKFTTEPIPQLTAIFIRPQLSARSQSQLLLAYPQFPPQREHQPGLTPRYHLGPVALYVALLETTTTEQARSLSLSLIADEIELNEDSLGWTLHFEESAQAERVENLLQTYFSFHDLDISLRFERSDNIVSVLTHSSR